MAKAARKSAAKKTGKKARTSAPSSKKRRSSEGSRPSNARTGGPASKKPKRKVQSIQSTGRGARDVYQETDEDLDPRERYMTLGDHLEELRKRLLWIIGVVISASIVFGFFSYRLHAIFMEPIQSISEYPLIMGKVAGPAVVIIKLSLLLGFLATFPIVLYILWGFVTPAVSKKVAWIGNGAVLTSGLLFWGGVIFTWFFLFPFSIQMFFQFMLMGLENTIPQTTIEEYYNFLFMVHMGAGLIFQIPLLMVALGAVGIIPVSWHKQYWRYFVVGVFIVSALLTPPDPITQMILAVPIITLYAISVIIVWFIERARRKKDALELE
ncbi:MAG: twin-arginine translocase subunit TatC [Leptospiraceae bacterium]|nr:twin-arginine translocase subunit TatC [Leptospiraceae bacterium]